MRLSESKELNNDLRLKIYEEFSPEIIVEDLEPVNNIKEYRHLRVTIESRINELFEDYIKDYPEKMKQAFRNWKLVGGSDIDEEKLINLLYEKNRVFYDIFLAYVEKWWLDNFLDVKDINDIISLLKVWLPKMFDKIFVNWYLIWKNYEKNIPTWLHYAWVNETWLISYKELTWESFEKNLEGMFNEKLINYIDKILEYSNYTYSQKKWDEIQVDEVPIWKNSNSKLGFVGPQEAYFLENKEKNWKLAEPHVALYIKESFEKEKKEAENLFKKYFGDDYKVSQLNTYLVEPILEAGSQWFRRIAWESVPNSEEVAKKLEE